MHDLSHRMRAAVDVSPPTRIDLDTFIAGEQRRSRRMRWAGAATGAAALVAGVLTLPPLLTGGGSTPAAVVGTSGAAACPTPGPVPTASPEPGTGGPLPVDCAQTVPRLAGAVRAALATLVPTARVTAHDASVFVFTPRRGLYQALFELERPDGVGFLTVEVGRAEHEAPELNAECDMAGPACTYERTAAGTVLLSVAQGGQSRAQAYLPDGTLVSAYAYEQAENYVGSPPLTAEQLLELVRTDGLGLFPDGPVGPSPARDKLADLLSTQLASFLHELVPEARFDQPRVEGAPATGYRTVVDLGSYGTLDITFTPFSCGSEVACKAGESGGTTGPIRPDSAAEGITAEGPINDLLKEGSTLVDLGNALHY
ncbi:hypothetical protein [Catellatospora tritici]|uniref:hypothetical protein n=1 Tax=Catellatospora tritici TaxID=2851566 RepID=UPI001C2D8946|nr:hypothetical protein [Catellatospora tritici]MBV1848799.1 hypothetical protein [Catellatospora tritici]